MYAQVEKPKENKSRAVANSISQKQTIGVSTFQLVDNRHTAVTQGKLRDKANNHLQTQQAAQLSVIANSDQVNNQAIQMIPRNRQDFRDLAQINGLNNGLIGDLETYWGYRRNNKQEEIELIHTEAARDTLERIRTGLENQQRPLGVAGQKEWTFIKNRVKAAIKDEEMESASFLGRWYHRGKKHGSRTLKNVPSITTGFQAGSQLVMGNKISAAAFGVRSATSLLSTFVLQSRAVRLSDIARDETWTHKITFKIIPTVGEICKLIEALPTFLDLTKAWKDSPLAVIASGIKELRGLVGALMSSFEGNPTCKAYFNSFVGIIESVLLGLNYKNVLDEKRLAYIINLVAKSFRHLTQLIMQCFKQQEQIHPAPQVQGQQNAINFEQHGNVQVYEDGLEVHDLEAQI